MTERTIVAVEDLTPEQLREEVAFWRQDAAARLSFAVCSARAWAKEGNLDAEAEKVVSVINPTVAALRKALAADYDDFHCEACSQPIRDGQLVFSESEGGYLHAACMGEVTSTEGFVDPDGEPLPPDAPIPEPYLYAEHFTPAQILAELEAAEAYRDRPDEEAETAPDGDA